jgi:hypothetical protein
MIISYRNFADNNRSKMHQCLDIMKSRFYSKTRTLIFSVPLNEDPRSMNGTKSKILEKIEEA